MDAYHRRICGIDGGVRGGTVVLSGFAAVGHSLFDGTYAEAAAKPPVLIASMTGRPTPATFAVAGSVADDCAGRVATVLAGDYAYFAWWCAINDVQNGRTGVNIFRDSAYAALNTVVAAGKVVILADELPCNGLCTDAGVEEAQNYNLMAHAWCDINPTAATCLRDYADFGDVTDPTYLEGTLAAFDFFHLRDAGYIKRSRGFANLVADAGRYACTSDDNLFDFATGTGSSLGAACGNAASIYSVDGGAITCTSAAARYCNKKGLSRTGIATGDIVSVSANRCRVEPGYDGGLGVRRENAGTNYVSFPTNLAGADWAGQGVVVAAPTCTGGYPDPLGGTTGVLCVFEATNGSGLQGSLIYNLTGIIQGSPMSECVFALGLAGATDAGNIGVGAYDSMGGNKFKSGGCDINSSTWTQCENRNFAQSDPGGGFILLGNTAYYEPSPIARGQQQVILWGASGENAAYCTSFMNGTRAAETVTATVTSTLQTQSIAVTYDAPAALTAGATLFQLYKDGNNDVKGYATPSTLTCDYRKGGSARTVASTASDMTAGVSNRAVCWFSNAVQGAKVSSVADYFDLVLRTNTLSTGAQELNIGGRHASGNEPNGIIRNLSVWSKAGCR